jgi:hypothetical protein
MGAPVPRLLEALRSRGHEITEAPAPEPGSGATLLLSTPVDWMKLGVGFARWKVARGVRLLVVSRIGTHPDARAPGLRDLWRLEEYARVSLMPTLALRLAPVVSATSPFWRKLASRPRLGAAGRAVVMPVLESDAVEAMHAALSDRGPWDGWFDVAGTEALTLEQWSEMAAKGAGGGGDEIAWEPPLEELLEHRLSEPSVWQERYRVRAREVSAWASEQRA